MARTREKLPSLSNVVAGSMATLDLPLGLTYDEVWIKYSGVTAEQLKNFQVEINGNAKWTYKTATKLLEENAYYGRHNPNGWLVLYFSRAHEAKTLEMGRIFALGTADLSKVTLKVDIDPAAAAPSIEAWAVKSPKSVSGLITKKINKYLNVSAGGRFEIDDLLLPPTARIAAVHFYKAEDDITKITLKTDQKVVHEAEADWNSELAKGAFVARTPQAGYYHMDFCLEGDMYQAIPCGVNRGTPQQPVMARAYQDFRFELDVDAAGQIEMMVEYLDAVPGI